MFCTESNLTVLRKYQVVPQPTTSNYDPTPKQMVIINEFIREPLKPKHIRIIFVPILPVHVHCGDEVHLLNVLLDTSSPYSYIDDKVAHKLQLERTVTTPHLISKKYCSFDYAFETVNVRISNCANPLIDDTVKLHVDYDFKLVTVPDHIAEFMKSLFISEGLEASADFDPARNDIVIGLDLLPLFMKIDPSTASPHNLYQMDLKLDDDTNALFVNSRYGWAPFGAEDVWFDLFIKEEVSNIRKFLNSLDVDRGHDHCRNRGRNIVIRLPLR